MKAAAGDLSSHCWGVGAIVLLDVPGAALGQEHGRILCRGIL